MKLRLYIFPDNVPHVVEANPDKPLEEAIRKIVIATDAIMSNFDTTKTPNELNLQNNQRVMVVTSSDGFTDADSEMLRVVLAQDQGEAVEDIEDFEENQENEEEAEYEQLPQEPPSKEVDSDEGPVVPAKKPKPVAVDEPIVIKAEKKPEPELIHNNEPVNPFKKTAQAPKPVSDPINPFAKKSEQPISEKVNPFAKKEPVNPFAKKTEPQQQDKPAPTNPFAKPVQIKPEATNPFAKAGDQPRPKQCIDALKKINFTGPQPIKIDTCAVYTCVDCECQFVKDFQKHSNHHVYLQRSEDFAEDLTECKVELDDATILQAIPHVKGFMNALHVNNKQAISLMQELLNLMNHSDMSKICAVVCVAGPQVTDQQLLKCVRSNEAIDSSNSLFETTLFKEAHDSVILYVDYFTQFKIFRKLAIQTISRSLPLLKSISDMVCAITSCCQAYKSIDQDIITNDEKQQMLLNIFQAVEKYMTENWQTDVIEHIKIASELFFSPDDNKNIILNQTQLDLFLNICQKMRIVSQKKYVALIPIFMDLCVISHAEPKILLETVKKLKTPPTVSPREYDFLHVLAQYVVNDLEVIKFIQSSQKRLDIVYQLLDPIIAQLSMATQPKHTHGIEFVRLQQITILQKFVDLFPEETKTAVLHPVEGCCPVEILYQIVFTPRIHTMRYALKAQNQTPTLLNYFKSYERSIHTKQELLEMWANTEKINNEPAMYVVASTNDELKTESVSADASKFMEAAKIQSIDLSILTVHFRTERQQFMIRRLRHALDGDETELVQTQQEEVRAKCPCCKLEIQQEELCIPLRRNPVQTCGHGMHMACADQATQCPLCQFEFSDFICVNEKDKISEVVDQMRQQCVDELKRCQTSTEIDAKVNEFAHFAALVSAEPQFKLPQSTFELFNLLQMSVCCYCKQPSVPGSGENMVLMCTACNKTFHSQCSDCNDSACEDCCCGAEPREECVCGCKVLFNVDAMVIYKPRPDDLQDQDDIDEEGTTQHICVLAPYKTINGLIPHIFFSENQFIDKDLLYRAEFCLKNDISRERDLTIMQLKMVRDDIYFIETVNDGDSEKQGQSQWELDDMDLGFGEEDEEEDEMEQNILMQMFKQQMMGIQPKNDKHDLKLIPTKNQERPIAKTEKEADSEPEELEKDVNHKNKEEKKNTGSKPTFSFNKPTADEAAILDQKPESANPFAKKPVEGTKKDVVNPFAKKVEPIPEKKPDEKPFGSKWGAVKTETEEKLPEVQKKETPFGNKWGAAKIITEKAPEVKEPKPEKKEQERVEPEKVNPFAGKIQKKEIANPFGKQIPKPQAVEPKDKVVSIKEYLQQADKTQCIHTFAIKSKSNFKSDIKVIQDFEGVETNQPEEAFALDCIECNKCVEEEELNAHKSHTLMMPSLPVYLDRHDAFELSLVKKSVEIAALVCYKFLEAIHEKNAKAEEHFDDFSAIVEGNADICYVMSACVLVGREVPFNAFVDCLMSGKLADDQSGCMLGQFFKRSTDELVFVYDMATLNKIFRDAVVPAVCQVEIYPEQGLFELFESLRMHHLDYFKSPILAQKLLEVLVKQFKSNKRYQADGFADLVALFIDCFGYKPFVPTHEFSQLLVELLNHQITSLPPKLLKTANSSRTDLAYALLSAQFSHDDTFLILSDVKNEEMGLFIAAFAQKYPSECQEAIGLDKLWNLIQRCKFEEDYLLTQVDAIRFVAGSVNEPTLTVEQLYRLVFAQNSLELYLVSQKVRSVVSALHQPEVKLRLSQIKLGQVIQKLEPEPAMMELGAADLKNGIYLSQASVDTARKYKMQIEALTPKTDDEKLMMTRLQKAVVGEVIIEALPPPATATVCSLCKGALKERHLITSDKSCCGHVFCYECGPKIEKFECPICKITGTQLLKFGDQPKCQLIATAALKAANDAIKKKFGSSAEKDAQMHQFLGLCDAIGWKAPWKLDVTTFKLLERVTHDKCCYCREDKLMLDYRPVQVCTKCGKAFHQDCAEQKCKCGCTVLLNLNAMAITKAAAVVNAPYSTVNDTCLHDYVGDDQIMSNQRAAEALFRLETTTKDKRLTLQQVKLLKHGEAAYDRLGNRDASEYAKSDWEDDDDFNGEEGEEGEEYEEGEEGDEFDKLPEETKQKIIEHMKLLMENAIEKGDEGKQEENKTNDTKKPNTEDVGKKVNPFEKKEPVNPFAKKSDTDTEKKEPINPFAKKK